MTAMAPINQNHILSIIGLLKAKEKNLYPIYFFSSTDPEIYFLVTSPRWGICESTEIFVGTKSPLHRLMAHHFEPYRDGCNIETVKGQLYVPYKTGQATWEKTQLNILNVDKFSFEIDDDLCFFHRKR